MMFLNLAFYKFVDLKDPEALQTRVREFCEQSCRTLRGTVLLGYEGINCFIAAIEPEAEKFMTFLGEYPEFQNLPVKRSWSTGSVPYSRLLVKVKKEIIPIGIESVKPHVETGPRIAPEELKGWYDSGKDFAILDTRNGFEVDIGTFEGAIDLRLKNFREFTKKLDLLPEETRKKPLVMFCTGGIRCEKATALAMQKGFSEVYQLDGGILNYFDKCGPSHFKGDCFVFDKRVALNGELKPSGHTLCFKCREVKWFETSPLAPTAPAPVDHSKATCPRCGG